MTTATTTETPLICSHCGHTSTEGDTVTPQYLPGAGYAQIPLCDDWNACECRKYPKLAKKQEAK